MMRFRLLIANALLLLFGIVCLYLVIVDPLGREYVPLLLTHSSWFIHLPIWYILIMNFVHIAMFQSHKFQGRLCGAVLFFLFAIYLFFFTPERAVVLGILLATIGLVNSVAVYCWVRYKKIPPDPRNPGPDIFRTVFGKTKTK